VVSLEEALADPHFVARGLFSSREGAVVPDLPLPIDPAFRAKPKTRS
jgi:hypothetical protein